MNAFLNGLGVLCACGRGTAALSKGLENGWQPPVLAGGNGNAQLPTYPLPPSALDDKSLGRKIRRADRLSKMAVLAAADALCNANLPADSDRSRIGLIVTSAFGPHVTTFQFLDDILMYGDGGVSPTVFSHSVQNATAAYITTSLDLQGPGLSITQVNFAFHHGLLLATHWLESGRCDHILVGGADELGSVFQYAWRSLRHPAKGGKIEPFRFQPHPGSAPGEGSAFVLLSATPGPNTYGKLSEITLAPWVTPTVKPSLHLLEADGTLDDERLYAEPAHCGESIAAYTPLFGSLPGGTPLSLAAAALMLKEQMHYASPTTQAAESLPVCRTTTAAAIESIRLTRLDCLGRAGTILLHSEACPTTPWTSKTNDGEN